jgi:hypothetical protein
MKTERCREWREALGAYALGHLQEDERVGLEAHLEGCPDCRAEADSLLAIAQRLPHADPAQFGPAPTPPPELGRRIAATIGAEKRSKRRHRRLRLGLGLSGATVVAAAAVLAIFVLAGNDVGEPEQQVAFRSLPAGVKISATLEPRSFGTEIHMYVAGIRSGTLCQVYMRGPGQTGASAGSFRYRWGSSEDSAVLSAALDLSRAKALVVHAGNRTFVAPLNSGATAFIDQPKEEEPT